MYEIVPSKWELNGQTHWPNHQFTLKQKIANCEIDADSKITKSELIRTDIFTYKEAEAILEHLLEQSSSEEHIPNEFAEQISERQARLNARKKQTPETIDLNAKVIPKMMVSLIKIIEQSKKYK